MADLGFCEKGPTKWQAGDQNELLESAVSSPWSSTGHLAFWQLEICFQRKLRPTHAPL